MVIVSPRLSVRALNMTRSELLLLLMLSLCLLALPVFSGDAVEHLPEVESMQPAADLVVEPTATKIGSCGAEYGCDVSKLGSSDSQRLDHDALLAELAASVSAE